MSESTQSTGGTSARRARWVAAWQSGVRASSRAVGLTDLESTMFLAASTHAAALFGTTPAGLEGRTYLEMAELPEEAAVTFALARDGRIDAVRSRRQLHRPDGTSMEVQASGWVIQYMGHRDLGLWVVDDLPPADPASGGTEPGDTEPGAGERRVLIPPRSVDWHHLRADATFALDDGWCVASASSGAASLLGWRDADLLGTPIVELTHPDDLSTMLMSFALTTTCSEAAVPLRLGNGRGSWHPVWALVTISEVDGDQRFSLRLGDGLGAGAARTPAWPEDMLELTIREAEVVSRLLTGQRVATIAREMFLSPRTIRNHLTAVFRKADVHSQDQLIQLLRNPRETS